MYRYTMIQGFARDRLTWVMYLVLGWFAFLQAAPGLVVPHLRDELDLSYSVGGLHVAAFAAGSMLGGLVSARLERLVGRGELLWSSAALMSVGTIGLTAGHTAVLTIGSVFVMGAGGGVLLVTLQAVLSDRHGDHRSIALTEANLSASAAYLVLIGALSLAAALHLGWRTALLVSLLAPLALWWGNRSLPMAAPPATSVAKEPLPRPFWTAVGILVCTTAAEWCATGWGASFAEEAADVSAERAVSMMGGFFVGVLVGRTVGSGLARRTEPTTLLGSALVLSALGFAVLWTSTSVIQTVLGLTALGLGIANLFPMGMSVAVSLAPGRAVLATGRAVTVTSLAVLVAPLTVGALADATSLKAALLAIPLMLCLAGVGLAAVLRATAPAETST